MELNIEKLLDLSHTLAGDYLATFTYPWEALAGISDLILELGPRLNPEEYAEVTQNVWVHKSAQVFPSAYLGAPCIIGPETEVRHGAFVRGSALVGAGCVVGNSVELKNVILFDGVQVPHYNYVGDSILGYKSHMGAGAITSNVKADKKPVVIKDGENLYETGRKKVGATLGDFADIGCNSVLNPGTVIGRRTSVYPLSSVRGAVPPDCIYKAAGSVAERQ
ncbi:MAG: UDP-N-acetylglucosamine pyrophosphorylase [Oscillibacter sp.]|jgi:NDP-sugar pyrophosphorylase family protein|nr:UDP-N-acetylglucosamine pyrophosphorylase [Oscillibacter sp.]MCI9376642.1 UDP-N-acetylglucosamine pyrophosphorylase [Oscillibacter sp.]MCI9481868.1 UDP-N-acetylglucosamine pyrophosphorylase [Oscillibacter sp.]